ncbi:class I SAM-dependent methyltransferase [Larkinella soli]|uniref:class I SAM-dependent methyltransferase n=1 Tax=Larkinella soli TaxID=1770527 RepID=UPI000FFBB8C3|nr:class I SAM-dependent methyltransferase [Larkinella soli]
MPSNPSTSSALQEVYKSQYADSDRSWRDLGARLKADDIRKLCGSYGFDKMLDVGSGDGAVLQQLDGSKFCPAMYSLEISESGVGRIRERNLASLREVRLFDGYTIPYAAGEFRLATCSHVIEHVEHPRLLLREIARVADYQFFEVPIDFSFFVDQKTDHFLSYGHINIFTPSLFRFLLKSEGYEILREDFVFYDAEVLRRSAPSRLTGFLRVAKSKLIEAVPFLRKIKPNAYAVLCRHQGGLKIF